MDSEFFDGLGFGGEGEKVEERKVSRHRYSSSMDGSEMGLFEVGDGVKKSMPAEKLAELALIDPKRAKRFIIITITSKITFYNHFLKFVLEEINFIYVLNLRFLFFFL